MIVAWVSALLACSSPSRSSDPAPSPMPAVEEPEPPQWPDPTEPRYAGSHILITWKGAVGAPPDVTRSEDEARALAEDLRSRVTPETFAALARERSEGPSAPRGGHLGTWLTGTMVPDFERAVASVQPGEIGPVVRTPFGWHVVMREPVVEVAVSHILVGYAGALQSDATRSREDARTLAEGLRAKVLGGTPFEVVARESSEDSSATRGGDLGLVARGQMVPGFEDAAFALDEGAVSEVVETPYGFHVLKRRSLAEK
ncbi:MAG: peptidylprolyl isomerase [Alphaproteobacteria bacterium]|nr:peptidylprolyl isomerase [Alphaproteobacteria bacterium]